MLAVSFAFLLVAPAAFAATTPSPLLSLRQSLPTSDDGCESACTALENAVENAANSAKPTAALCTSAIVNDYATCYSCLISEGAMSQSLAQETVDDYVSSCRSAGFSVNGATVSGSSSGGGGSLGDPSIIGGPSVVGSGSSTGRSTATGSVRSGSSVTVTASGAPASSSTARSGGSSSSEPQSGDSGSGVSSGSGGSGIPGFVSNDASRVAAGVSMVFLGAVGALLII